MEHRHRLAARRGTRLDDSRFVRKTLGAAGKVSGRARLESHRGLRANKRRLCRSALTTNMPSQTFAITGLHCQSCVQTVGEKLRAHEAVKKAEVSLHPPQVTLETH